MNFIWDKITEWLKGLLVGGIVSNLSGLIKSIDSCDAIVKELGAPFVE